MKIMYLILFKRINYLILIGINADSEWISPAWKKELKQTVSIGTWSTLFENHRKSLNQHCERSELRLQKFNRNAKNVFWKPGACGQTVLPDRSILIGQNWWKMPKLKNSNETFWVIFKQYGGLNKCLLQTEISSISPVVGFKCRPQNLEPEVEAATVVLEAMALLVPSGMVR